MYWRISVTIRKATLIVLAALSCSPALAAGIFDGTPQEQAACRPDVRRLCRAVPANAGSGAFLSCLQANRPKLSAACAAVLKSHGQ